jgi:hypothetical protein
MVQIHSSYPDSNVLDFPRNSKARSLLIQSILAYQQEMNAITDVAPDNSWLVVIAGRKPQLRTQISHKRRTQQTLSYDQAAKFRQAAERRDRKKELCVLIDELSLVLARGL